MPDARGNFKGAGWSRKRELSWERIFLPKVAVKKVRGEHFFAHPKVTPTKRPPL